MKILRAYKTELDPTCKQVEQLLQHAGCARWAFNWGLRRKIEAYKATGKSPTAIDLHRELNVLKTKPVEEGGIPWMYESSKCAPQEALRNLDTAYKNFFRRCKLGAKRKGFPRFKSRKNGIGSFRLTGSIRAFQASVQLPLLGAIRLAVSSTVSACCPGSSGRTRKECDETFGWAGTEPVGVRRCLILATSENV